MIRKIEIISTKEPKTGLNGLLPSQHNLNCKFSIVGYQSNKGKPYSACG